MTSSPVLEAANLPDTGVPFVRELVLEIVRRVPANLGTPPRFVATDLENPDGCANSARSLVQWFDTVPESMGQRVEELEAVFGSLLGVVQDIDNRVRRAVLQARGRAEDEVTFVHTLHEVLVSIHDSWARQPDQGDAKQLLGEVLRRIGSREQEENRNGMEISAQFEHIHRDLDQLRDDIARVEAQTRDLREKSLRDPLTGLWNRRAYASRIAEELSRAVRYQFPLAVAVWDIDHCRVVNNTYGHSAGDLALQALAGRVLGMLRRSDFIARISGEEFLVIFTSTTGAQARLAGEKICHLVAEKPVDTPAGPIHLTASVGVAELAPGDDPERLYRRAAAALHRAKTDGRNRVSGPVAQEPPPPHH